MDSTIISTISGKGGVGKSFVCANLGVVLAKAGFKTLLIDMDIKLANLEILLGMEGKEVTLQNVLNGEAKVDEAIYPGPAGVHFIPAGLSLENVLINIKTFDDIMSELIDAYEYIILDAPAGLDSGSIMVMGISERAVLVTNPELTALADAIKTKIVAEKVGCTVDGTVINMVGKTKGEIPKNKIERALGRILAVVPYDPKVGESIQKGIPYVLYNPKSTVTKEFLRLAQAITGVNIVFKVEKKGFK